MQDTTVRSETGHDRDGSHTRPSNTTAHTILTVGNLQVMQPHSGQPLQSAKRANRHSAVFNCALTAGPRDSPTSSLAYPRQSLMELGRELVQSLAYVGSR
jgi:hypothetical protein